MPVAHLRGESVALIDGAIWELLTFVPGQSIGWANAATTLACPVMVPLYVPLMTSVMS